MNMRASYWRIACAYCMDEEVAHIGYQHHIGAEI